MKEYQYVSRKLLLRLTILLLIGIVLGVQIPVTQTKAQTPSPTPVAETWNFAGTMTTARVFHTATLITAGAQAGNVLVAGGENWINATTNYLNSAELYNIHTNTWAAVPSMTFQRAWHTATALTTGTKAGDVLVVGGLNNTGGTMGSLNTVELYDPANVNNPWTTQSPIPQGRSYHTATLLLDGRVLVIGGYDFGTNQYLTDVELYDPGASSGTNPWTARTSMHTARAFHTATLLANGDVLVTGGITVDAGGTPTVLDSAELYHYSTDQWDIVKSMNTPRNMHSATLLYDGRHILVAGGVGTLTDSNGIKSNTALQNAEIYDSADLLPEKCTKMSESTDRITDKEKVLS